MPGYNHGGSAALCNVSNKRAPDDRPCPILSVALKLACSSCVASLGAPAASPGSAAFPLELRAVFHLLFLGSCQWRRSYSLLSSWLRTWSSWCAEWRSCSLLYVPFSALFYRSVSHLCFLNLSCTWFTLFLRFLSSSYCSLESREQLIIDPQRGMLYPIVLERCLYALFGIRGKWGKKRKND